jgi:two-component system, response regulator, stage 0 sporulation protein F
MKILIVDDIFTNRLLLVEILKSMGHDYMQAENGKQAIEIIKNNDFDIVLMDIEMPVMNGLETTLYIRQNMSFPKNRIPIVALTAHNPQLFFEEFKNKGFDKLLSKPYNIEKLSAIISEIKQNL